MLNSEAQGSTSAVLLASVSAANTAAATGAVTDIAAYEGHLVIVQNVGVVTGGSITGKIQTGDDAGGSDMADVTGATFTAVTTSNDPLTEKITVECNKLKKYIRYVGTIVTGPAVVGVALVGKPKYST